VYKVKISFVNTNLNRQVLHNHLHGLIFELKERMNSRQDRPVIKTKRLLPQLLYLEKKVFEALFFSPGFLCGTCHLSVLQSYTRPEAYMGFFSKQI
jgi:hypothetical protein